jgi:cullin-5
MNEIEDGVDPIRSKLESHIIQDGLADMETCADGIIADPEKYVEKLLELFNRYSSLVKSAFHNDPRFLTSRDKVS